MHTCHWPTCTKEVSPKMWGCKPHWFRLPKEMRDVIWKLYVPGQEISKTPSEAYLAAASVVQLWAMYDIWKNGSDEEKEEIRAPLLRMCEQIGGENFDWPEGLRDQDRVNRR